MSRTIYDERYRNLVSLLRGQRERLGLRQVDVARRMGWTLSTVSRTEQLQRRLDLLETLVWAKALGLSHQEILAACSELFKEGGDI